MNLAVLILAAGKSSRMKDIKQLLKVNGKSLLAIAIGTSKKITPMSITCVLGANAEKIQQECTSEHVHFVINNNYEKGVSSSIVAGLKHLLKEQEQFDGVLIILADQPAIALAYYTEMKALFLNDTSKIIASDYQGKFGVPAIFPASLVPELLRIKGDKGAKEVLENYKERVFCPKIIPNLLDLDTQEDYKKFINSI
jgi:molybdenum cofactor cytidylyltransferase